MTTFTAHRSSVSGWIVVCHVAGYGNTKIASFGHDQDRAEALAMDLNSTVASHLQHHAVHERARLNAAGMDTPAQVKR